MTSNQIVVFDDQQIISRSLLKISQRPKKSILKLQNPSLKSPTPYKRAKYSD